MAPILQPESERRRTERNVVRQGRRPEGTEAHMSWSGIAGHLGRISMVALALVAVGCGDAWAESPTETLQGVFAAVMRVIGYSQLQLKPQELWGSIQEFVNQDIVFHAPC